MVIDIIGQFIDPDEVAVEYISLPLVSDDGVRYIVNMPHITSLHLARTGVSDAVVPDLKRLKSLRTLDIRGTRISEEDVMALREALPETDVQF